MPNGGWRSRIARARDQFRPSERRVCQCRRRRRRTTEPAARADRGPQQACRSPSIVSCKSRFQAGGGKEICGREAGAGGTIARVSRSRSPPSRRHAARRLARGGAGGANLWTLRRARRTDRPFRGTRARWCAIADWLNGNLRYELTAGLDSWNGARRTASVGALLDRRWARDRCRLPPMRPSGCR